MRPRLITDGVFQMLKFHRQQVHALLVSRRHTVAKASGYYTNGTETTVDTVRYWSLKSQWYDWTFL